MEVSKKKILAQEIPKRPHVPKMLHSRNRGHLRVNPRGGAEGSEIPRSRQGAAV